MHIINIKMAEIVSEKNITLKELTDKYQNEEIVILSDNVENDDTTFGTWYVYLDENDKNMVTTAWKKPINDDW